LLKNDQYPKTITKANNVFSNHRFDNAGKQQNHKPKEINDKGANNNNKEETPRMSFAMLEGSVIVVVKRDTSHRHVN
jgi:hypothetical protein